MSAPTKDDVYAALRERGIRAIRVTERIVPVVRRGFRGLRKRDWFILALTGLGLLAFASSLHIMRRHRQASLPTLPSSLFQTTSPSVALDDPRFLRLAKAVDDALVAFRESATTLDVALIADCTHFETNDVLCVRNEIEKGRRTAEAGRRAIRGVYDLMYGAIPAERKEATAAAQRLFGEAMDEIDAFSESLDADECALELLVTHLGAWHIDGDDPVWKDPKLAREFSVFRRAGVARIFFSRKKSQKDY